ncbi:hypothetical protein SAMN05661086_02598 [Anaeromicropila populeti]|uniref:Uncharacterized protein n=1 Tax=Anaeromicropila populeti TaxID=37658 RepID=A0A1I6KQS7_9FIRM|nr:hypothetical protein SAMN05661086_02598 [Anaeromicropila populeti]
MQTCNQNSTIECIEKNVYEINAVYSSSKTIQEILIEMLIKKVEQDLRW